MNEARVRQVLIAKARRLIYDEFSFTEDFDNADAFEALLAESFGGHVQFTVTDLEVFEGESGMKAHLRGPEEFTATYFQGSGSRGVLEAHFDLDCEIDEYAKADLTALDVGLRGYMLPAGVFARTVQRAADGSLTVTDAYAGGSRERRFTVFPDGRIVHHHAAIS